MNKRQLKKRLRVVKKSIRNACGTSYIALSEEIETIEFLLLRAV
jgi:hypothetical protein